MTPSGDVTEAMEKAILDSKICLDSLIGQDSAIKVNIKRKGNLMNLEVIVADGSRFYKAEKNKADFYKDVPVLFKKIKTSIMKEKDTLKTAKRRKTDLGTVATEISSAPQEA